MKKLLFAALATALLCALLAGVSLAEDDTLTVGGSTPLGGNFLSEMFGNNTADIEARTLLHGYNLMQWQGALGYGSYGVNRSAVSGVISTAAENGDHTYTVSIYSDLVYSDGTPITAKDYAFSMLLSLAPQMTEIGAQTVVSDYVAGSDAYRAGETDVLSGMRLLNDTTFSVTVKAEYEPYFYEMALLDYCPLPIAVIAPGCEVADEGEGVFIRNIDPEAEEPVFTADLLRQTILDPQTGYMTHPSVVSGAYTLESYDETTHEASFLRNPNFKGDAFGRLPVIERVVYKAMQPGEMIEALQSGEVDLVNKCTLASVIDAGRDLVAEGGFAATNYPRSGYSFVGFACEKPAVSSEAVRQAIAHCLDRAALVSDYVGDYGMVVDGYYGLGQWMFSLAAGLTPPPVIAPGLGATDADFAAYENELAAWQGVNLSAVPAYDFDVDEAVKLLEDDGWTLNRDGEPFVGGVDDVRCKDVDGELVALDLLLVYPEGNAIGDKLQQTFVDPLARAGVALRVEPRAMDELLATYYRTSDRDADLMYLATNFATVFDPSYTYAPDDAYQGTANRSGLADEELYNLAVEMRRTQPGDTLTYCQRWVAFQERWAEVLPAIPMYSNIYYDFYVNTLRDYAIGSEMTWAEAVMGASIGEPLPEEDAITDEAAQIEAEIAGESAEAAPEEAETLDLGGGFSTLDGMGGFVTEPQEDEEEEEEEETLDSGSMLGGGMVIDGGGFSF